MKKLYNDRDGFIAYYQHKSNKKNAPYVIFVHGYLSNMNGSKAMHLEGYCRIKDYNFIRFDQYGCGKSSGDFLEQTITSQLSSLESIINLSEEPVILVGSSAGGWLTLLASLKFPTKIKASIYLAPAPDFTENLIWKRLSESEKELLQKQGHLEIPGNECDETSPISYKFIMDAKNHLLLESPIPISHPVHLIHGMQDEEVPYDISVKLANRITSDKVVLKLIKDSKHRLSSPKDLKILENSIEEVLSYFENQRGQL